MPTWHQSRNPVPWWHETQWTVVTGTRFGEATGFYRTESEADARRYAESLRVHHPRLGAAIVPPANRPDCKYETVPEGN